VKSKKCSVCDCKRYVEEAMAGERGNDEVDLLKVFYNTKYF
jgi:hypothetical protein